MDLFPPMSAQDVADQVARHWDLTGPLPVPRFQVSCFVCGTVGAHARVWNFHRRNAEEPGRFSKRCSFSLKCPGCGFVSMFGIPLSDEDYDRFTGGASDRVVHWRKAERLLNAGQNQRVGRVPKGTKTN